MPPSLKKPHFWPRTQLRRRHLRRHRLERWRARFHVRVHRAQVALAGGAQGEPRQRRAGFGGLRLLDPLVVRHAGEQPSQLGCVGGAARAFVAERVAGEPPGLGQVASCQRVAGLCSERTLCLQTNLMNKRVDVLLRQRLCAMVDGPARQAIQ